MSGGVPVQDPCLSINDPSLVPSSQADDKEKKKRKKKKETDEADSAPAPAPDPAKPASTKRSSVSLGI